MTMKVMTIVGTRPEIIKLSRVIAELELHTDHFLIHTGQNFDFELNEIFFQDLGIKKPDCFLEAAGKNAAITIGMVIAKADEVLAKEKPEALLVLGDTNSCLAAYAAKRRKIPIFHMEAGNRCFDQRVPEEINRKIIDHISDINLPYTEHARRYLIAEGIRPETIIKTGSPMNEVLRFYENKVKRSDVLTRLNLSPGEYFVVSSHREENIDCEENFRNLLASLQMLSDTFDKEIIVSTHPRTRKRFEQEGIDNLGKCRFMKPLGFSDYVKLQKNAFCVISDSGTITEESAILDFPAVTIRQAHERPEGMDVGTLIMCGLSPDRVLGAVNTITAQHNKNRRVFEIPVDYLPDNVSMKVVRIILSYTEYINRTVWHKKNMP